jgi:hypothetical protein
MKNVFAILSLISILFFNACSGSDDGPPPTPPVDLIITTENLIDIFTDEVRGTSKLTRTPGQITFELVTTNLIPGHVYQVMCAVYNKPENCSGICDDIDFKSNNASVEGIAFVMSGKLVNSASATFTGTLKKNDITTYDWIPSNAPANGWGGLQDPMTAEIFLDVRSQGIYQSDKSDAQLNTYQSACSYNSWDISDPGARVPEEIGECAFIQFSHHVQPSN